MPMPKKVDLTSLVDDSYVLPSISEYYRNYYVTPSVELVYEDLRTGKLIRVPQLSATDGETTLELRFTNAIAAKDLSDNIYSYARKFIPGLKPKRENHNGRVYSFKSSDDPTFYLYLYADPRLARRAHKFHVHSNFVYASDIFLGYLRNLGVMNVNLNKYVHTGDSARRLARIKLK